MKVGVLAIQGSVEEHVAALGRFKRVEAVLVRKVADLEGLAGLIMPGGESTTIGKLLKRFGLAEGIKSKVAAGMGLYGTCAGAILMAKEIAGKEKADNLALMGIEIERNAYGRQMDSFETELDFVVGGKIRKIPATFIRAPKILKTGLSVEVLAKVDGETVAAREGKLLASTFHPEMTDDLTVHGYFLELIS